MYYLLQEDNQTKHPHEFIYAGYFRYKKEAEQFIKSMLEEEPSLRRGHFKILIRDD